MLFQFLVVATMLFHFYNKIYFDYFFHFWLHQSKYCTKMV